jgi:hypothetical protein
MMCFDSYFSVLFCYFMVVNVELLKFSFVYNKHIITHRVSFRHESCIYAFFEASSSTKHILHAVISYDRSSIFACMYSIYILK